MTGEQFRICGVQVTEKCILLLKKLKVDILTHVPKAKPSHRFLSSSSMWRETTHFPSRCSVFSKSLSPLMESERERKL